MSEDKFEDYICEYPYEGSRWVLYIKASSFEDARARLRALAWAEVMGNDITSISVPGGSLLYKLWTWLRGRPP